MENPPIDFLAYANGKCVVRVSRAKTCGCYPLGSHRWQMPERGVVGVRDLVARGYFIPGGVSQRGRGSGSGVPCRTLSDRDSCQPPMVPDSDGFWHWYNNFWNPPYPLAQNFDTI